MEHVSRVPPPRQLPLFPLFLSIFKIHLFLGFHRQDALTFWSE